MEMRAFPPVSVSESSSSSLRVVVNPSLPSSFHATTRTCQTAALARLFTPPRLLCSSSNNNNNTNSSTLLPPEDDDDDSDGVVDDLSKSQSQSSICTDGVQIEMERFGDKGRRILSRVAIQAPLEIVWNILTDYERLADFIPGLAVSQLLHKTSNSARLFQIGEQKLAFGLKFNAGGIIDCYEKELESLPFGQKRDIEFKMIEGDFQIFEGKWSIEQGRKYSSLET
ncbi:uncharacterized protein LOC107426226 isoform X2 [Ziziphus jujuba]|uniref:Uncharacterized protein LOC107426226 isoform X2 n=1 Tax=Ziziphus jujuba TaxID=326968 RepID=A0A6P4A7S6_ZIZJJ|nr:uncharacterized protein LOC107426226 isoform X2 [Ziziphus jujuba]